MIRTTISAFHISAIMLMISLVFSGARKVERKEKGAVKENCAFDLSSAEGEIRSPGYPYFYPNDLRCTWTIRSNRTVRILLQIHTVDLEPSKHCEFDRLLVYDGSKPSRSLLRYYCNQGKPGFIRAESDTVSIIFTTDGSESGQGFYFSYSMEPICKELYTKEEGIITSPGFPNGYKDHLSCTYQIATKLSRSVYLQAMRFELAPRQNGECDAFVAIVKDSVHGSDLLTKFCGSEWPRESCYPGNKVTLKFHTNLNGTFPGFQFRYQASDRSCSVTP